MMCTPELDLVRQVVNDAAGMHQHTQRESSARKSLAR
jgi:hypothetical protein